jgi:predicted permease
MQNEIVDKLSAIAGVTFVGFAGAMSLEGYEPNWDAINIEGRTYASGQIPPLYLYENVSPGLFRAAGTRIVAGRELTWADVYGHKRFGMVSENLARALWGSSSAALGKRFSEIPGSPWWEVIGVIQDVHENGIQENAPEIVYWPTMKDDLYGPGVGGALRDVTFVIRSPRTGTAGFLNQIQQAVWSVNANLPLASVRTMQDVYDRSLARTSFTLVMLGIAGAMALLIGIIGIYGVISYLVARRTAEIGLRLALGAARADVFRHVIRGSMRPVALGLAIGLAGSLAVSRALRTIVFGVSPQDPLTIACAAGVLVLAALLASSIPAWRAARIDPMTALRRE